MASILLCNAQTGEVLTSFPSQELENFIKNQKKDFKFEVQIKEDSFEPIAIGDYVVLHDDEVPIPTPTGLIWSSNREGKWNDGNPRTLTQKQPSTFKDDGSIFTAASGSPVLKIDGDGVAHLISGSGGTDNISLKLRCRHQAGGACENRAGGEGFAVDRKGWDAKREKCHNIHSQNGSGNLKNPIADETWSSIKFTCKDEGTGKIRLIGEVNGIKEMDLVDNSAEAWFFDKVAYAAESWFWIRNNNADNGRIYTCRANYDARLELEFKFEPSTNSIGLRNVNLFAL